jgi:hypothetical protein
MVSDTFDPAELGERISKVRGYGQVNGILI